MEEQRQVATNYKEISEELGKRLVKLYVLKIFPRQGKVFADLLFETGVEAGTAIAALADLEDRDAKLDLLNKSMIKLNQTAYIITVMKSAGFYTMEEVMSVEEYVHGLIRAVKSLLAAAYAQRQPKPVQQVQRIQHVQRINAYTGYNAAVPPTVQRAPENAPVEAAVKGTAPAAPAVTPAEETKPAAAADAAPAVQAEAQAETTKNEEMADGFNDPA